MTKIYALLAAISILWPVSASALTLAQQGQPRCSIVLADGASDPEKTAAMEIQNYLSRITGNKFVIKNEKEILPTDRLCHIYVGASNYTRKKRIDTLKLAGEEWLIKTFGNNLIIVGDQPRGTLYAAYHFLEDVIGVHWWNPWEESVPSKRDITIKKLNMHGKPVFSYRDIYMLYGNDSGRFAVRNRLNSQGDDPISPDYGGARTYGPPYQNHTFYMYIDPVQYFKTHPAWFSLIKGERKADKAQLCLTNQQLRETVLVKLKHFIEKSKFDAIALGLSPPKIFNISQNDSGGHCQCDNCQVITRREGSEAGPLLDFINYLAKAIRGEYPDVYIDTLAYEHTEKPPKTIQPLDNVIIRLCNTRSNLTRSILHIDNKMFHDLVMAWANITKHLRIWNYAITYDADRIQYGLPLPSVHLYADDYRFFTQQNIEGVFTEHEFAIFADMRDLKVWVMMKLLENPYADYKTLIKTFTDGFYGPAGTHIRVYLELLERAADKSNSYIKYYNTLPEYRYLTPNFIADAQAIFDEAEKGIEDNATYLKRLRHARLSLDRATILLLPMIVKRNNAAKKLFSDEKTLIQRYQKTLDEQIDLRIPKDRIDAEKKRVTDDFKKLLLHQAYLLRP